MDIKTLVKLAPNPNVPSLTPGDVVKVTVKVIEGEKSRSQAFQGVVIRIRKGTNNAAFTVRRVTHGIGVERTFMAHSPLVEKVEVLRRGDVRRARLFYLRGLSSKEARLKEKGRALSAEEMAILSGQPGEAEEQVAAAAPQATADASAPAAAPSAGSTAEAKAETKAVAPAKEAGSPK